MSDSGRESDATSPMQSTPGEGRVQGEASLSGIGSKPIRSTLRGARRLAAPFGRSPRPGRRVVPHCQARR
jgi:hypothetical protein